MSNWSLLAWRSSGIFLVAVASVAGYLGISAIALGASDPETKVKYFILVFGSLSAFVLGIYSIFVKEAFDRSHTNFLKEVELQKDIIESIAKAYITQYFKPKMDELESKAQQERKHTELRLEDNFERIKVRRDRLLVFSKCLHDCTKAFRALANVRSDEALDARLAPALGARERFSAAREDLEVHRAVSSEHQPVLREYSKLLMAIVIDVRRSGSNENDAQYDALMKKHYADLDKLDDTMARILKPFLAPREEDDL